MATKPPPKRPTKPPAPDPIGTDGLTDKQRVFIVEYLTCWNASEAARRAGYSAKTAYSIGSENLRKPEIRAAIDARLQTMAMGAEEVLARLSALATADLADFLNDAGSRLDLKRARAQGKLHLVKKFSKTKQGTSIELHDAKDVLVQLGRYHGLFAEKHIIETWQDRVIDLLKQQQLTPADVIAELGPDVATDLIIAAGLSGRESGETGTAGAGATAADPAAG